MTTGNSSSNFGGPYHPISRPALLLDFANSERVDQRVLFTRASIATRVNKNLFDLWVELLQHGQRQLRQVTGV